MDNLNLPGKHSKHASKPKVIMKLGFAFLTDQERQQSICNDFSLETEKLTMIELLKNNSAKVTAAMDRKELDP